MSGSNTVSMLSALFGVLVMFWIFYLAIIVLVVIAMWKLFEKAGEPGWASLIPFYNSYVLYKISWGNGWYFLLSLVPGLICEILCFTFYFTLVGRSFSHSFGNTYASSGGLGLSLLIILMGVGLLAVTIITYINLAKAFGQNGGFACGLIFLPPIFLCILAFSKNIFYVGIPGKTPPYGAGSGQSGYQQHGYQNPYYQPNGYTKAQDGYKYCSGCGTLLKNDDRFCPNCGRPQ